MKDFEQSKTFPCRQRAQVKQIQLHFEEKERPPVVAADAGKNVYPRVYVESMHSEVRREGHPGSGAAFLVEFPAAREVGGRRATSVRGRIVI